MDDALTRKTGVTFAVSTAAVLFITERKALIENAEGLIAELNQVGYRISAEVVSQLKSGFNP